MSGNTTGLCIVPDCLNAYFFGCSTRFFLFPKDDKKKKKWLKSLKLTLKDYYDGARICYAHFDKTDYKSNNPRLALKQNAVPSINGNQSYLDCSDAESIDIDKALENLSEESSLNENNDDSIEEISSNNSGDEAVKKKKREPIQKQKRVISKPMFAKKKTKTITKVKKRKASKKDKTIVEERNIIEEDDVENVLTQVCRTCLITGCKMYSMQQHNLEQTYQDLLLTGITSDQFEDTIMPQMICFECVRRLQNFMEFSAKCFTAWSFLKGLIQDNKLTINNIKSIDRQENLLTTRLTLTHFEPNHSDLQIEANDSEREYLYYNQFDDSPEPIKMYDIEKESNGLNVREFDAESDKWDEENTIDNISEYPNDIDSKDRVRDKDEFNDLFIVKNMTIQEQREEVENRKKSRNYINSKYKCDKCFRGFKLEKPFKDHMKKHSNLNGELVCDICKRHFRTRRGLYNHICNAHSKYISCRKCPFGSVYESAARGHKNYHDGYRYRCKMCPNHYSKRSAYVEHLRRHHPQDVICHLCGASFALAARAERHFRLAHNSDDLHLLPTETSQFGAVKKQLTWPNHVAVSYVSTLPKDSPHCTQCDVRFLSKEALGTHLSNSASHRTFIESKPARPYSYENRYLFKKKTETDPAGPYTCEQCGEECENYRSYTMHFRDAHPDKNRTQYSRNLNTFMCDICGKIFQSITILNDHRGTHLGNGPFACDTCGKTYKSKIGLRFHKMREVNRNRFTQCTVCGKSFSKSNNLSKHMKIHTHKPYSCDPCNKRFCSPSEKRAHELHYHLGVPWPKKRGTSQRRPKGKSKSKTEEIVEKNMED